MICAWKNKEGREKKANRNKKKVTKSKLHWWTLGLRGERKVKGVGERTRREAPSDRQRHEAVVLLDVTFEYV